jgi:hypothetical protein
MKRIPVRARVSPGYPSLAAYHGGNCPNDDDEDRHVQPPGGVTQPPMPSPPQPTPVPAEPVKSPKKQPQKAPDKVPPKQPDGQ